MGFALGGVAAVRTRAEGIPSRQPLAKVPSESRFGFGVEHWSVGRVVKPVAVYREPSASASLLTRLKQSNANGYPTLVLLDTTREVDGVLWSRVWVAMRPNGTRGWVREGGLSFYTTTSLIDVDLAKRRLSVYVDSGLRASFRIAIGRPGLETPKGRFFVNQKLRPASPNGPYGVLAIGISAFQPKLSSWPQGGAIAIHGTNQPELLGKAVTHGCIRMSNRDVREVSRLVPAGSPVLIH